MKSSNLFLLLIFSSTAICENSLEKKSIAAPAISEILLQHPLNISWQIDVIFCGQKGGKSENLIEKLLRNKKIQNVITVSMCKKGKSGELILNTSSLLFIDDAKDFIALSENITWQNKRRTRYNHLVYIADATKADIPLMSDGFSIDNVDFLVNETENSMELVTSYMFTPRKCRSILMVTINYFEGSTMRWENQNFYPEKYRNFQGCNLTIGFNEVKNLRGIWFNIYRILSEPLNFAVNTVFIQSGNETFDIVAAVQYLYDPKSATSGYPIGISEFKLYIPPGELFTPLEKMFLTFEYEVWLAIFGTLVIGFVAIQVINLCPIKVRNFVFGFNIRTPTINLAANFLAGGQYKVPGRNFARFLLILFSIWCLIIRTCYQSELFKHLQADERKHEAKSLAELVAMNFSFGCFDALHQLAEEQGLPK